MKRIKVTKRTGIITTIVLLALGLGACSAHHGHPRNMDPAKALKRITKKLDLNMEQQGKLEIVLTTAASFKESMMSRHTEVSEPLLKNLAQPVLDVDELNTNFDRIGSDLNEFRRTMITQYAEFHAGLNDEQRQKLLGFVEKMEKHKRH